MGTSLRREAATATAGFRRIWIDEVEALTHEALFIVEHHACQIEEGLRVNEDPHRLGSAGIVRGLQTRAEDEDAVALAGLRVKADVVAQPRAAAALNAEAQAASVRRDAFLGQRNANALQRVLGDLDSVLRVGLKAFRRQTASSRQTDPSHQAGRPRAWERKCRVGEVSTSRSSYMRKPAEL